MCSIALLASVFASFAYHCSGEQRWHKTDVFLAVLALAVTLGATVPHMSVTEALLAGLILTLALASALDLVLALCLGGATRQKNIQKITKSKKEK